MKKIKLYLCINYKYLFLLFISSCEAGEEMSQGIKAKAFFYEEFKPYLDSSAFSCGKDGNTVFVKEEQKESFICEAKIKGITNNKMCNLVEQSTQFEIDQNCYSMILYDIIIENYEK